MLEKSCQWWLICYLLFFCHGGAEGQLQWVVQEKVTAYGQNLILFCPIENCCSEPAGWSVGPKAIILDVKTFSNDPKVKYHGTYNTDGFGVVIRNLSEADLNVTYRCVYGFDQSTPKYLLHGDVFRESTDEEMDDLYNTDNQTENEQDVPDKEKENETTATIIVVPIGVIMVLVGIGIVAYCVYRSRIKKKEQKSPGTEEEMKHLTDSENQQDNPFPVHTINQGRTNYARLGLVVVNISSNILREIMRSNTAPEVLYRLIKNNNLLAFDKMTHKERASVNTLSNGTYDNIDFITLYKLMRLLSILDDPTQGWGELPTNADVAISDDVERLRIARNKIVHCRKADIDLIDMSDYFSNIVNITKRIDTYLSKLPDQGFTREVYNCQTHCMDSEMEKSFYQDLKDIEDIKEKFSVENLHFFYGKTFSNLIQDVQNKAKRSVRTTISLVLEDIHDDKTRRILNELKTEINTGLDNIEFKQAVSGSLIIYIDILDFNLPSTEHELCHQIYFVLCRVLQLTGFNMKTENEITVVLIKEEDDIDVELSDNWETYVEEISLRSNTLCLKLDVNTDIFNTEQKMQSTICLLLKRILGSNGKFNIELVSARSKPGIVFPQSVRVEPVSGTSGVEPTTCLQDQSAKEIPMKSNNENEGDVSTILQESQENDNPFPVHTINQGKNNYARLGLVVVDIFPNILREIIYSNISPEVLYRLIRKQQKNKMTHEERSRLYTLTNRTYDNIDFITLYKLMRSLSLLDDPTQGWGEQPTNADVTITDDVERLRIVRNKIVHRIKSNIDLIEMSDYLSNIANITQRIDTYLGKLPDQGFAREVLNFQTHCMDSEMEQKYHQALQDIEDIKEKFSGENFHFYYGKTFSDLIQDAKNKTKSSVTTISLVLEDINDDNERRILNELKTEINSGLDNIEFKQVVSG